MSASRAEIEQAIVFMVADVRREVSLAQSGQGGGNLLAAFGLLCYTEFMGSLVTGKSGVGESRKNFDEFFRRLGPTYDSLLKSEKVYDTFRNGMAHEYFVKKDCEIAMLTSNENCGIVSLPNGHYRFVVEQYLADFEAACNTYLGSLP